MNEIAEHLGHADPGFTAHAHFYRAPCDRSRLPIEQAIAVARRTAEAELGG